MKSSVYQYKETLLQWVWEELRFNCSDLRTECGKQLGILSQGKRNKGAGPDFLHARILVDGMEWCGSVEIHKDSGEWVTHGHHEDPNFNTVILHVVCDSGSVSQTVTEDGHVPWILNLQKYIARPMHRLIKRKHMPVLACSTSADLINQDAFARQIQKTHPEYFESKVAEVLSHYPPGSGISKAWKQSFITQCYQTLGISDNVTPMKSLSKKLLKLVPFPQKKEDFMNLACTAAFQHGSSGKPDIEWVTSGIRPAGHPSRRVNQAAEIHWFIEMMKFEDVIKGPEYFFSQLSMHTDKNNLPGKMYRELLFHLAVLPSFYLLGELIHSKKLKRESRSMWMKGSQPLPSKIKREFEDAGFTIDKELHKLGVAHQFKRYCNLLGCQSCEVFKNSIQA